MAQSIKIKIADRTFSFVAATPEDESRMRNGAEGINRALAAYNTRYPDKSLEEKLCFVALNEAIEKLKARERIAEMGKEAEGLQNDIESYLTTIEKNGR